MPTIKLTPSSYTLSNSNYIKVSNASNMYTDTSSDTYATFTNTRTSTTTYYAYIGGFNFDDVPSSAIVNSYTIRIKGRESGVVTSTGTTYAICLVNNTTAFSNTYASEMFGTSVDTIEVPHSTLTWENLVENYSDVFGIRVCCRRYNRNTTGYVYIYGAEIEVDYTLPTPRTVTTSLTGNGTIVPEGRTTLYEGEEFNLTITPTDLTDEILVTKNNVDVTSELDIHYVPGQEVEDDTVLGNYTHISGSFSGSGESHFSGLVGKGYNASTTSSNYYSGSSSSQVVFTYDMGFDLPEGSEVTDLYVMVNGHAESTSQSSEYMCAQLICGDTELSDELNFKSVGTSNSTQTIHATTLPTAEQAANIKLQCRLGYYGGSINGATCFISYKIPTTTIDHYTYTYTVVSDDTIIVTIGSQESNSLFVKQNNSWVKVTKVFKKINGSWIEQNDLTNVFEVGKKYIKG